MRAIKSTIKSIMSKKGIKTGQIAQALDTETLQVSVWLSRDDGRSLEKLTTIAELLGCRLAFEDKETGDLYRV